MNLSSNYLQNLIKSFAVKNWQKYTFKREWLSVIVLLLVLQLSTSAVSIFSGFFYLDNFFFSFLNAEAASKVFAIIALILIEGLNILFLSKFFKFALRLDFLTALMPLTCALITFSISFVTSTNGIALFASKSEDLTKVIEAKYKDFAETAKAECDANVAQLTTYIETIKSNPENWSNGRRCVLSEAQNRELATAYTRIEEYKTAYRKTCNELDAKKAEELRANNSQTIATADKYYKIVAFIMLIQVAVSAALWFFWSKISAQDAADVEYRESVDAVYDKANKLIDDGLSNVITQKFGVITTAFAKLNDDYAKLQPAQIAAKTPQRRTGFAIPETSETDPENAPKMPKTETHLNAATVAVSAVNNAANNAVTTPPKAVAVCEHCGKELTPSQIVRRAKYCCSRCRVAAYNGRNPDRKQIVIANQSLKD
jgi:hypothetical protein